MDLLQRELARKQSVLDKSKEEIGGSHKKKRKKYLRRSEVRRLEEQEEEERRQDALLSKNQSHAEEARSDSLLAETADRTIQREKKKKKLGHKAGSSEDAETNDTTKQASATEKAWPIRSVTLQLRAFGLPIRFFGESPLDRRERLRLALAEQHTTLQGLSEMDEFRLGKGHGIRNPFLERDKDGGANTVTDREGRTEQEAAADQEAANKDKDQGKEVDAQKKEDENTEDDPPKRIYKFLKDLLKEWEKDLEIRSDAVSKSVSGRNESKTLKQCKDYIRPLFKLLKQRRLGPGMQAHLIKIVEFSLEGEFVKAHDAYIDVAIGRAAWPIGVTMVGIHARSGRAKIESSNVAHVMNSELQRKYLTSVKRLLTYAQKKRPDVDPSKKVT